VSALLGRIPRTGDRVSSGPLEFEVLSTRRRRVGRVRVKVRAQRREEARA
jgi:CBS domain containing-hemolysin-like protein